MPAGARPAACILSLLNPVPQQAGTLTEVPLKGPPFGAAPGEAGGPEVPPRCDTSSSPALHNARAIQFHPVHPSSFPTGRPATGLCTQTLADRKASLTPITLELASVCGGSLVTAALAVNQFLPGYRLSAPQSLSYYSAAVRSSAGPVWTGAARPHGSVVPTHPPPPPSSSAPLA